MTKRRRRQWTIGPLRCDWPASRPSSPSRLCQWFTGHCSARQRSRRFAPSPLAERTLLARPELLSGHKSAGMASTRCPGRAGAAAPSITLLRPGEQLIPLGEGGSSERVGSPGLRELDAQSANLFSAARDYCSMRAPLIRSVLDLIPSLSLSILDWILPPGVADGHPSWPACRDLTGSIMGHGHDGSSFVSVPALLHASRARGQFFPFSLLVRRVMG